MVNHPLEGCSQQALYSTGLLLRQKRNSDKNLEVNAPDNHLSRSKNAQLTMRFSIYVSDVVSIIAIEGGKPFFFYKIVYTICCISNTFSQSNFFLSW